MRVARKGEKMVYSNKFVMCVLLNGTPCEELANGTVNVPFNTEYVLRFRNKNDRRAVVKISIDGENISEAGFIIPANSHIDVKRPINKDAAFKFVSLDSSDAIDHGKNGPNEDKIKGTIEAKFYLEKELSIKDIYVAKYPNAYRTLSFQKGSDFNSVFGTASCLRGFEDVSSKSISSPIGDTHFTRSISKDGCTVEGSTTGQNFRHAEIECEDVFTTLKVFLQGYNPVCKKKITKKDLNKSKIHTLEQENDKLREKIAQLENEKLREKLALIEASKKPKRVSKNKKLQT